VTNEHGTIECRLEKLERQNRRMKLAGLGAFVIAGTLLLMGQARPVQPSTIRGNRFVLVDAQGQERAVIEMYKGGPVLALCNANKNPSAVLSTLSLIGDLSLCGANRQARALDAFSAAGPSLALYDAHGTPRAQLGVSWGYSGLTLSDVNGKTRAGLHAFSGGPMLDLYDASGFEAIVGSTDVLTSTGETHETSAASIVLFGKDKKVLWSAPPQN